MRTTTCLYSFFLLLVITASGCATGGDRRVATLYQPAAAASGGAGDLFLVQESPPVAEGSHPVQWVLGPVTNSEGRKMGQVVSDIPPGDTIADALRHELAAAGYIVQTVTLLPTGPVKGLRLVNTEISLEVTPGWSHDKAECSIEIVLEPWVNGAAISRITYKSRFADAAVVGRGSLPGTVMKKALQSMMSRAAPEVVAILQRTH